MSKKVLSIVLMLCMMLTFASCGGDDATSSGTGSTTVTYTDPYAKYENYDDLSGALYKDVLGDFADAYATAKKETTNVSKRFALMAIAEAKLMESALMLPTNTQGGLYALSRVAPYTVDYTMWGNDSERFHQALIATDFIKTQHRDEMKAKWAELRGTGNYEAWAKKYLADKGYTLKSTYNMGYTSDPKTWDVLNTSRAADSEAIVNTYDGLMEYDVEGTLKPALATGYTVSDDGLTYTFTIRQGVKWVDSQGRELGEVTADDFVAGMQHMMDAEGGLEYLVEGIIVNASAYIKGDITDFAQVGVKAVDKYTLQYKLEAPCSFFTTMLGYGVFAPMNRSYYLSKGGKFGAEFDDEAETYTYGKTKDDIAYCGPYLVTNATDKSTIVFAENPTYWNKDNINIKTITWLFNDGTDVTKAYNDAVAGTIDGASLNASTLKLAKDAKLFDIYAYTSSTNATSYMAFYNINRGIFHNVNDENKMISTQTEKDAERTAAAMRNVHFRRAISFAVDRAAYNAQSTGEELKYTSLRNSYTPGTFVVLPEDVTIKINGTDKTYKAGTNYGQIMQDQIDADGVKIKVWDPKADSGVGSSDGFDGWYNVENAVAEMKTAVSELAAIGIEITAENPIYLDLPYPTNSEVYTNRAQSYKKSLEASLNGLVKVNLVGGANNEEWYYAGYYTESGAEANYDIYDLSGWGPDYGDPQTYLDTFLDDYAGYMIKCIGIY